MITTDPIRLVLDRLDPPARRSGNGWIARCPAHDDRHASLSISTGQDGRVLLKCFAGCDVKAIVQKLGVKINDLFPQEDHHNGKRSRNGDSHSRRQVEIYPYRDEDNVLLYEVVRYEPKDFRQRRPDGNGSYSWNLEGVRRVLFRLPELLNSREDHPDAWVFICEGEKDANNVAKLGLIATTNVGGAGKWSDEYTAALAGRRIAFLPHNDDPGRAHAEKAAASCEEKAAEIRIVDVPGVGPKGDVSDWIAAGGTAEELMKLVDQARKPLEPLTVRQLMRLHPKLRDPVIHGLLRVGETMNVIAPMKLGKTWLVNDLALSIATGRTWLGKFSTAPGDVLILDNELHGENSAYRIPGVAQARGILVDDYADKITVLNLRGHLVDLPGLSPLLAKFKRGRFKAVILDAFYRALPAGTDENDNGAIAQLYNQIDAYAERLGCCFIIIHHSTKGNQSDKSVVDVGSGASAQARAADTHLILRAHELDTEKEKVAVFDAAARSWPPMTPFVGRFAFPVWQPDSSLDPSQLKKPSKSAKPAEKSEAPDIAPAKELTLEELVKLVSDTPRTADYIVEAARDANYKNDSRTSKLLGVAVEKGVIYRWVNDDRKVAHKFATRQPAVTEKGWSVCV